MAGKTIGRNSNVNDGTDATTPVILSNAVALNASTSIKVADVVTDRIFFAISNNTNKDVWLKLQPATDDNDKKGIFVPRNGYWEMPPDNIYTGEISAIADSGTPDVYLTEY